MTTSDKEPGEGGIATPAGWLHLKGLDGTVWELRNLLRAFARSCGTCGLGAVSFIVLQIPLFRKAKKKTHYGRGSLNTRDL